MPKFKKSEKVKPQALMIEPTVYIPEEASINEFWSPLSPPKTEYESRRCSIGLDAYKQVTGK